jgi:hypothetical protein
MNLAMELTLDGLVRALKYKAGDLAQTAQRRYPSRGDNAVATVSMRPVREWRQVSGEDCHDSRGR